MIRALVYPALLLLAFGRMGMESEALALEEDALEKVMRVERVLLETSSQPASFEECMRATKRPRPDGVVSLQSRTNEPWHHRTCIWARAQS